MYWNRAIGEIFEAKQSKNYNCNNLDNAYGDMVLSKCYTR